MAPNNSFKPNLLRYTNNMAEKACHIVGSATQVGLTQALELTGTFMKLEDLLNHRVSYQVLITFDLIGAEPANYAELRETLARELELEPSVYLSKDDGGGSQDLPHNTLAALWTKDSTEQQTRRHFEKKLVAVFNRLGLNGRYVVLVAQNWAVAAGEF